MSISSEAIPSILFGFSAGRSVITPCAFSIVPVFSSHGFLHVFMQLRAFAKINLDLRVLGKREDGYHEVRTILQTIDWPDEISIESADEFQFTAHGVSAGEDNLVVKAVRAFERVTGESARELS
jgi:hypothetical protein